MLPHLVVLDLVGNPVVCATEGYRLLLLFKLRALKVLDGVAADAAELAAAQAEYAGRLTLSLLVSKCWGCWWCEQQINNCCCVWGFAGT